MELHPAWIGASVVVLLAIIGGLIALFSRLTKVETDVETLKGEVKSLRQRFHDFRDGTMRDAWDLFQEKMEALAERFRHEKDQRNR